MNVTASFKTKGTKMRVTQYTFSGYTATVWEWAYLLGYARPEGLRHMIATHGAQAVFNGKYGLYVRDAGAMKKRARLGIVLPGVDDEQHTGRESQESMQGVA